jgi:hypothetical protein
MNIEFYRFQNRTGNGLNTNLLEFEKCRANYFGAVDEIVFYGQDVKAKFP